MRTLFAPQTWEPRAQLGAGCAWPTDAPIKPFEEEENAALG